MSEFIEGMEPDFDPLSNYGVEEFPFSELITRLDGDVGTELHGLDDNQREKLAEIVHGIHAAVIGDMPGHIATTEARQKFLERVGRRFICLCWVLDPSFFPNEPSLRQLADWMGIASSNFAPITPPPLTVTPSHLL